MSIYTPPALNAVDFDVDAFTPEVLPANNSVLSTYTPPALNAVDFALTTQTAPTFPTVDFELLDSALAITGVSFTNSQTFGTGVVTTSYDITGVSFTNSQTFGAGTITTQYDITGASFTNSQSFGSGVVSQAGTQAITGVSFTNTQTFGAGVVSAVAEEEDRRRSNDSQGYQPKWVIKPDPSSSIGVTEPEPSKDEVKQPTPRPAAKGPTYSQLSLATVSAKAAKKIGEVQDFISSPKVTEILNAIELDAFKAEQDRIAQEQLEQEQQIRQQIEREIQRRANLRQKQADFAQAEQEYEAIKAKRQAESDEEEEFALMYMMLDAQD